VAPAAGIRPGCVWLLALLLFAGGCARSVERSRVVWPPPPESPRFEYIGCFSSPLDLQPRKNSLLKRISEGDAAGHLLAPFGISELPDGNLLVVDQQARTIYRYDLERGKVSPLVGAKVLKQPLDLAVGPEGTIYVADGNRILKLDQAGRILGTLGRGVLKHPSYLAYSRRRKLLYVSDSLACRILVFAPDGTLVQSFGSRGTGPGELFSPQGLALDEQGRIYVADFFNARIAIFDGDGQYLRQIGRRGGEPWNFSGPRDLAFDSEGHLHVLDSRKHALMSFNREGRLLLVIGGGPTVHPLGFGLPTAIWIDGNDRFFISERYNSRVSIWQYLNPAYLARNPLQPSVELSGLKRRIVQQPPGPSF